MENSNCHNSMVLLWSCNFSQRDLKNPSRVKT